MFKECADIQTPDMLNLPIPKAEYENVVLQPSEQQKEMVASLAERAEAVRDRRVEPHEDNMLKITNDGRKLALDQRLINPLLPDEEHSKVNALAGASGISGDGGRKLRLCDVYQKISERFDRSILK